MIIIQLCDLENKLKKYRSTAFGNLVWGQYTDTTTSHDYDALYLRLQDFFLYHTACNAIRTLSISANLGASPINQTLGLWLRGNSPGFIDCHSNQYGGNTTGDTYL